MTSIAVVGASGYVGDALCKTLQKNTNFAVKTVTRENYEESKDQFFDILINTAMPSGRFWARNNPAKDFEETVIKTAGLVYKWKFGKFIQISTVSARCQLDTVYGRNKAAAEDICGYGNNLIVRLGPMYSKNLSKGVLIDMLHGKKVFIDGRSKYCFTPLEFVASWIASNLECSGIKEVGSRNAVPLQEIAKYLGVNIDFEGMIDHQEIQNPDYNYPDARNVFSFLDELRKSNLI